MPGGQRYRDLAAGSSAKNASAARVKSLSVVSGMPCPVICMKPTVRAAASTCLTVSARAASSA